jgi:hypothetical protein
VFFSTHVSHPWRYRYGRLSYNRAVSSFFALVVNTCHTPLCISSCTWSLHLIFYPFDHNYMRFFLILNAVQDHIDIQLVWRVHVIHNCPVGEICLESVFAVINCVAVRIYYLLLLWLLVMHTQTAVLTANQGFYTFFKTPETSISMAPVGSIVYQLSWVMWWVDMATVLAFISLVYCILFISDDLSLWIVYAFKLQFHFYQYLCSEIMQLLWCYYGNPYVVFYHIP